MKQMRRNTLTISSVTQTSLKTSDCGKNYFSSCSFTEVTRQMLNILCKWRSQCFKHMTWSRRQVCVCVCRELGKAEVKLHYRRDSVCEVQRTTGEMLQRITSATVLPNNSPTHTHTHTPAWQQHTLLPNNSPTFFHSNYLLVLLSSAWVHECVFSLQTAMCLSIQNTNTHF